MKLKRLIASAAAIGLLIGALTACSANAGSAAEAKLRDYLSAVDGIARLDLTANNTLPFAGSVSGNVVLDDGISDERVGEILDTVGEYQSRPGADVGQLDLQWTQMRLGVAGSRAENSETLDHALSLLADPHVDAVLIGAFRNVLQSNDFELNVQQDSDVVLIAHDQSALFSAFDLATDLDASRLDQGATVLTADEKFIISASSGSGGSEEPQTAVAIYDAIAAELPITEAALLPGSVSIRVQESDMLTHAQEIAATIAAQPEFTVSINAGAYSASGAQSPDAEALFEATSGIKGIESVKATGNSVTVELASVAVVQEFRAAMGSASQYPSVEYITITVPSIPGDGLTDGFSFTAPPASFDSMAALATALYSSGNLVAMHLALGDSKIVFSSGDDAQMRETFAASAGLWPTGLKLGVSGPGTNFAFFDVGGTQLVAAGNQLTPREQQFSDSVIAAWDAS